MDAEPVIGGPAATSDADADSFSGPKKKKSKTGHARYWPTRAEYDEMKTEFEKTHFYFAPLNTFVEITPRGLVHHEREHAEEYFSVNWGFNDPENPTDFTRRQPFLDVWRMDPARRCIQRIVFEESADPLDYVCPLKFECEKKEDVDVSEEEDEAIRTLFDELVTAVTSNDDTLKKYLLDYLAHMLQRPLEQPGVAIVLTGAKGVGKDTLLDFIRLHLIGAEFSHCYTETRQFFEKHDVDRKDKIFIKVEDSDSALCKQHAKDLRARITAREGTVNPKGKSPITFRNYARYFFSANQAVPVGINDDNDKERRFVILAVAPTWKNNFDFFNRCYNETKGLYSPLGSKVIGTMLMERDISQFQVRALPVNEYQESLYEAERSPEQRFIEDGWPAGAEYTSAHAFQKYQGFCASSGFQQWTESAISFGQKMAYFVMQKSITKRVGGKKVVYYKKPAVQVGAGAGAGTDDSDMEANDGHNNPEPVDGGLLRAFSAVSTSS